MRDKSGCKGFSDVKTEEIIKLYIDGLTMKEIGAKFDISPWTVLDRLNKANVKKLTRHFVCETIFSTFTPDSCYWAGFLAADGWIQNNKVGVELNIKDHQHLEKLCDFAKRDKKLYYTNRKMNGKTFEHATVILRSSKIVRDLKENFNIVPAKSLILQPPLIIPKELRKHFIRGYFDGDGHLGWHKHNHSPRFNIISGSLDMLTWLYDTIKEENTSLIGTKITKKKDANCYTFEFQGSTVFPLLDWVYSDSTCQNRLDRKYQRRLDYIKMAAELKKNKLLNPRPKVRRVSKETTQEIIKMYNDGCENEDICAKLNICEKTIYNHLNDM